MTVPPRITEPPKTTTGRLYSSASLTCKATGSPTPSILWYKDKRLIINNNTDPAVLSFTELNLSDRGFYHCEARNIIDGRKHSVNSSTVLLNITSTVNITSPLYVFNSQMLFSMKPRLIYQMISTIIQLCQQKNQ